MVYKKAGETKAQQMDLQTRLKKYADDLAQANNKLREQENQLKLIIDHLPALISYVDSKERFRFSNKQYEEWFGYAKSKIYGKSVKEVRGENVYKTIRPYVKRALSGETVTYDSTLYKKDSTRVYFNASYVPDINLDGEVMGFYVLLVDITERKLAEEKLKEKEEQFQHLVDANVIGVIITSLDGAIYEANDIFLKMVGYTRADLRAGKINWIEMTPPEFLPNSKKVEKEVLTQGAATPFEKEYIRKDGIRVPALVGDVLLDRASRKTIAFILDISKQKEVDKRKDEFIALASHELKTPLTSLKMYGQLIERFSKDTLSDRSAKLLSNMDKQIDKLANLVDDLLDVSRIQSGKLQYKKETFVIDKLVKEVVDDLQRLSPSHTLVVEGQTHQKVRADRDRIKQVLTNLLNNAIKYSPKADRVVVEIIKSKEAVQICVQDFGLGIPVNQQDKIFDRFFQVKRHLGHTYSGLGLGLYITKEIVDRHGGKIWIDSKQGKGTTFYFSLPFGKRTKTDKKLTNS